MHDRGVWSRRRRQVRTDDADVAVLLSAQRALLAAVGPNIVGACVALTGDRLWFRGFVNERADEDEVEALRIAVTEMVADFPEVMVVDEEIVRVVSAELPRCEGHWVFLRLGVTFSTPG